MAGAGRGRAESLVMGDRIAEAGWMVVDEPGGYRLEPGASADAEPVIRRRPGDVPSVVEDEPFDADFCMARRIWASSL